eukprot:4267397-Amphidinium_carterae.1
MKRRRAQGDEVDLCACVRRRKYDNAKRVEANIVKIAVVNSRMDTLAQGLSEENSTDRSRRAYTSLLDVLHSACIKNSGSAPPPPTVV